MGYILGFVSGWHSRFWEPILNPYFRSPKINKLTCRDLAYLFKEKM